MSDSNDNHDDDHDVSDGHSYFQDHPNHALHSDEVSDNHDHQYWTLDTYRASDPGMPLKHKGHTLPRYIPVHGQKQYCDLIRKLSGADNKDEKVGQQDIGPLNIEQNQEWFTFNFCFGSFTTNQLCPGPWLPGGDNIWQGQRCDYGETLPNLADCLLKLPDYNLKYHSTNTASGSENLTLLTDQLNWLANLGFAISL